MRLVSDVLKVMVFPGMVFMSACGIAVLLLESALARVVNGGEGSPWRAFIGLAEVASPLSPAQAVAALAPVAAMGLAGVMLVWAEGDLLSLVLLVSVPALLPLMAMTYGESDSTARVPLLFREALARLLALGCACVAASLRYPGVFAPELDGFAGEGIFGAVRVWSGPGYPVILSSQVCAAAALFFFLLGRPACGRAVAKSESRYAAVPAALAEGAERAVTMLLFTLVCIGYPWKGTGGTAAWVSASSGMALAATGVRAWLEGRNAVFRRRALWAAPALAAFSLALALAAAALGV